MWTELDQLNIPFRNTQEYTEYEEARNTVSAPLENNIPGEPPTKGQKRRAEMNINDISNIV